MKNSQLAFREKIKQMMETNSFTRSFSEDDRHEGDFIIFADGKIFPMKQCTLRMKKTETGFEYIDSVTINLNK